MRNIVNKRFILCLLFVASVAILFWSGSRYPELNAKASMGAVSDFQALGLDVAWEVMPDDGRAMRVIKSTVNWLHANKRGMIFGLILAAGIMTGLSALSRKNLNGRFTSTLAGFAIGSPLGVCVNCATPVMLGMHQSGSRLETSLSTMFSSPTFNIVVLTMLFTMFPWHVAIVKIAFSLLLILIGVPVLAHIWRGHVKDCESSASECTVDLKDVNEPSGWISSGTWFVRHTSRNLLSICKTTIPLMVLAGFLGSLMIECLPMDQLLNAFASRSTIAVIIAIIAVSLVGTFLPVPMAMDVILAASLFAAGVPVKLVVPILFTSGIYSIFAHLMIYRDMSKSLATVIFGLVMVLGILAGVSAHYLDRGYKNWMQHYFISNLHESSETKQLAIPDPPEMTSLQELLPLLALNRKAWKKDNELSNETLRVERRQFESQPGSLSSERIFDNHMGHDIGLDLPCLVTVEKMIGIKQMETRAIASGDVHGDGWPDLIISHDFFAGGATLYANLKGKEFRAQELDLGELAHEPIVYAALVDLDNDGWLDLFLSTFQKGTFWLRNQQGNFAADALVQLTLPGKHCAAAAGFADLNNDGRLDIVLGNWTVGRGLLVGEGGPVSSRNEILFSHPSGNFQKHELPGEPGESLSVLVSDINVDGHLDLLVANDFTTPDDIFLGGADGELTRITNQDEIIPHTPGANMGFDSADLDNDMVPELLAVGIAVGGLNRQRKAGLSREQMVNEIRDPELQDKHRSYLTEEGFFKRRLNPLRWSRITDERLRQNCVSYQILNEAATNREKQHWLDYLPQHRMDLQWEAERLKVPIYEPTETEKQSEIAQISRRNVLLKLNDDGKFSDVTSDWGIEHTGWTWNAKFADFDLDGWQDAFLVNGFPLNAWHEPNYLFVNEAGQKFRNATEANGIGTYFETAVFSHLDMDLDGDLDLIVVPLTGPIEWHENLSASQAKAISFELQDEVGNRLGIGATITIRYEGGSQMREIKSSGGYASHDQAIAHFGISSIESVNEVRIKWPNGGIDTLKGQWEAGHSYRISRSTSPR